MRLKSSTTMTTKLFFYSNYIEKQLVKVNFWLIFNYSKKEKK
jgi:hypothetical protein